MRRNGSEPMVVPNSYRSQFEAAGYRATSEANELESTRPISLSRYRMAISPPVVPVTPAEIKPQKSKRKKKRSVEE
ncbi:MAG: hypothetical protein CBC38_00795 [Gammaproteobacteria bacterium TMED78]|nr:MAG: hypothetical protein CBC38_00795 [Gammaproteobacteria bacterium TMED78]